MREAGCVRRTHHLHIQPGATATVCLTACSSGTVGVDHARVQLEPAVTSNSCVLVGTNLTAA